MQDGGSEEVDPIHSQDWRRAWRSQTVLTVLGDHPTVSVTQGPQRASERRSICRLWAHPCGRIQWWVAVPDWRVIETAR